MAGDWLKIEVATPDKAEVLAITAAMGWDDPDLTLGKLFRVWRWFDQHTLNGDAPGVTSALLDRIAGVSGFAKTMESVGWLKISEGGLHLPNFERHNGKTAKNRALTANRMRDLRNSDADSDALSVTNSVPREDKREEKEKKEPRVKDTSSGFAPDTPPMELASHLFSRMQENNPGAKPPNLQAWAKTIDLMIRKDGRTLGQIRAIIDWSQRDEFWSGNILSADTLRKQFDKLTMQSQRGAANGNGNGQRRSDDSGSAAATPRDPRPCGKFSEGKETAADVIARFQRTEAGRKLQEVQKPTPP